MKWTPEKIAKLTELWHEGLSMGLIARALGSGVTRNMVAGRIHRFKIRRVVKTPAQRLWTSSAGKPKPRKIVTAQVPPMAIKPDRPWLGRVSDAAPDGTPVGLLALSSLGCKWPIAMKNNVHLFCNQIKLSSSPYCEDHERASKARHLR